MLASSSGVSSERSAFMGLVKNEIERLNQEISARGALTMIFKRGNIKARPYWPLLPHQNATHSALLLCMLLQRAPLPPMSCCAEAMFWGQQLLKPSVTMCWDFHSSFLCGSYGWTHAWWENFCAVWRARVQP